MQALFQWQFTQESPEILLQDFIIEHQVPEKSMAYFQQLFLETVRAIEAIDQRLSPYLKRTLTSLNPLELSILRLAVTELDHHPEVPKKVVVNEAIELAKTYGASDGYKFVNGVLDAIVKSTAVG